MALGDYTKVSYSNGTTPAINATNLNNNENKTKELDTEAGTHVANTTTAHGATASATANKIIIRDANGRAQVAAPSVAADIARKDTVAVIAPFTIYINGTTGDDANNGLTSGTSVKTLGQSVVIAKLAICASITISITAGTYTESITLDGLLCSRLNIVKNGAGTVQINGGISWYDGQKLRLTSINITGAGSLVLHNLDDLDVTGCVITNTAGAAIYGDYIGNASIDNSTITSTSGALDAIGISNVGAFYMSGNTISGGKGCVGAYNVGSLNISGDAWTVDAEDGVAGLILAHGTTCYMASVSGTLGVIPVCSVSGSVLLKGANTVTGAADVTADGGQIFA